MYLILLIPETIRLRKQVRIKVPDAIMVATESINNFVLVTEILMILKVLIELKFINIPVVFQPFKLSNITLKSQPHPFFKTYRIIT